MTTKRQTVLLALALVATVLFIPINQGSANGRRYGQVVYVKDGDTILVKTGPDRPETVRLAAIDAPEMKQPGGVESWSWLRNELLGKVVTVDDQGRDRYQRIIARVYVDGKDIGLEAVCLGKAWAYWQYDPPSAYGRCHADAKTKGLGLWSGSDPVPPWKFRHGGG